MRGIRSQRGHEAARVVVGRSSGRVRSLAEQVRRDPGRASHRQATQDVPLGTREAADAEAKVESAGLPSARKDAVVAVGRQMAEAADERYEATPCPTRAGRVQGIAREPRADFLCTECGVGGVRASRADPRSTKPR